MTTPLSAQAAATKSAARGLSRTEDALRCAAIDAVAAALTAAASEILAANAEDCRAAAAAGQSSALLSRLRLDDAKLRGAVDGMRGVARLADPLGVVQIHRELDDGLVLRRITCPVGVIGVVFEARPDALLQIVALALKSGNGALLKGGQEATRSFTAIIAAVHAGLSEAGLDPAAVGHLTSRAEVLELLGLDDDVDLIIPRGSSGFVRYVQEHTRIPVLGHADGLCHLYVDAAADLAMAVTLAVDAKTDYPAACNAIETLLVHARVAPEYLPRVAAKLVERGVELRGDARARQFTAMSAAAEADWSTEYGDLILAVKVVDSLEDALRHIATYGSRHTEAVVTEDPAVAERFLAEVDAAGVYHNASTRFADGLRYGFGAEVGISTQKLPPRGPVGLEGLVTYKYVLQGQGHAVADYARPGGRRFKHRDLSP
jgi:glutamate-5-semialdehyde dehydrogenase